MKACPTCQRTYADESLTFCLVDGAVLSAPYDPNATLQMPEPRTTDAPIKQPPPQSTILAVQPPNVYAQRPQLPPESRRSGPPWLLIGLGLTCFILIGAAVLGTVLWVNTEGRDEKQPNSNIAKSSPSPFDSPTVNPTPTVEDDGWVEHENTSINEGDRITYYPVTSIEKCQDDCAKDPRCKAFTFIKAGAYNPNDSAMCYLMSAIKTLNPSTCCFTAVKRDSQQ